MPPEISPTVSREMLPNEIMIDGFKFRINSKWQTTNYLYVNIDSYDSFNIHIYNFWVYPSTSELGLWRIDINENNRVKYKGYYKQPKKHPRGPENSRSVASSKDVEYYDYVQQTFVHIDLQCFINDHLNVLPEHDFGSNSEHYRNPELLGSHHLHQVFPIRGSSVDRKTESDLLECVDDRQRQVIDRPFILLQETLECGEITSRKDFRSPTTVIRGFSKLFEKTFHLSFPDSPERIIHDYHKVFSGLINIDGNINMVDLTRTDPSSGNVQNIHLYYLKVALTPTMCPDVPIPHNSKVLDICRDANFYIMPFLLTTSQSRINSFGLYTDYIPCGAYICKLFDYSDGYTSPGGYFQCTRSEFNEGRCNDAYSFIGKRYQETFPFTQIYGTGYGMGLSRKTRRRIPRKKTKRRKILKYRQP